MGAIDRRAFLEGTALMGMASAGAPGGMRRASDLPGVRSVRDFGAIPGAPQDATAAFQKAIDSTHAAGGGTVYVPPGEYRCGGLFLKSNVTLYLEAGATVCGSRERSAYTGKDSTLITARDAEYISILGPGVLHGQGTEDLGRRPGVAYEPRPEFRTGVIYFENCKHVILRDFTLLYSDGWACHLQRCEKVVVEGMTIFNNYFRTNSDGIDPVSCRDVRISNCHITAGDDCICLKADKTGPCEDIVITNCTTESVATAIKLGTQSAGDFRNITISNCTVRNSTVGVGFFVKDGGTIENVTVSNLAISTLDDPMQVNAERLRNMIYPIFIDVEKRKDDSPVGAVRDVVFSNIAIRSDNGILVQGMKESLVENLTFDNIVFRVTRPFNYAQREKHAGGASNPKDDRITLYARRPSYFTVANARNLVLDNVQVVANAGVLEAFPRSAVDLHNVERALLRSVARIGGESNAPVLRLHNAKRALVTGCIAEAGDRPFVDLVNTEKREVAIEANDFGREAVRRRDE